MLCSSSQLLFYSRETVTVLPCGHAAHLKCIEQSVQQNPQLGVGETLCPHCPTPTKSEPSVQHAENPLSIETKQNNGGIQCQAQEGTDKTRESQNILLSPQTTLPTSYRSGDTSSPYLTPNTNGFLSVDKTAALMTGSTPFLPYTSDYQSWRAPSQMTTMPYFPTGEPEYVGLQKLPSTAASQGVGMWSQHP